MADAETYRRLLRSLPEVEEGTGHGRPAWRVRGKFFAGLRDDGQTAVLKVDKGEKQLLMEAEPEIFFETPHYRGWGYFLVRLSAIRPSEAAVGSSASRVAALSAISILGTCSSAFPLVGSELVSTSRQKRRPLVSGAPVRRW